MAPVQPRALLPSVSFLALVVGYGCTSTSMDSEGITSSTSRSPYGDPTQSSTTTPTSSPTPTPSPSPTPTPTPTPTPVTGLSVVHVLQKYSQCVPDGLTLLSTYGDALIDSVSLGTSGTESLLVAEGGEVTAVQGTSRGITIGGVAPGQPIGIPWLWDPWGPALCPPSTSLFVTPIGLDPGEGFSLAAEPCVLFLPAPTSTVVMELEGYCRRVDGRFSIYAESASKYAVLPDVAASTTAVTLSFTATTSASIVVSSSVPANWLPGAGESYISPRRDGLGIGRGDYATTYDLGDGSYSGVLDVRVTEATELLYVQRFVSNERVLELSRFLPVNDELVFDALDWQSACDIGVVASSYPAVYWENLCSGADVMIVTGGSWAGFYPAGTTSIRVPLLPGFDLASETFYAGMIDVDPDVTSSTLWQIYDLKEPTVNRVLRSYRLPLSPFQF